MTSPARFLDAHLHLQDSRLDGIRERVIARMEETGVAAAVVNGTQEDDWDRVADLCHRHPFLRPSFGLHPWFAGSRSPHWQEQWLRHLERPFSCVGEIGLDAWIENADLADQEEVFCIQWRVAAERNIPASIHCLKAWGRLVEVLQREPRPARGFLLHSFGGPRELIKPLTRLGAYFSLSAYFAHPRKKRAAENFRLVPPERLLLESDAPDMAGPPEYCVETLSPKTDPRLNHPANIRCVYDFASRLLDVDAERLQSRVEENFDRFFGIP